MKPITRRMKAIEEEKRRRQNTPTPPEKRDTSLLDRFPADEIRRRCEALNAQDRAKAQTAQPGSIRALMERGTNG